MRRIQYISFVCAWVLVGCERLDMSGMFYGSSERNDERFEQSMQYNAHHGYRTITTAADDYRLYFAADFHVDSTTLHTQAWVKAVQADALCEVAIILGDMVNGRKKYPYFMEAVSPLLETDFPLFATAGNHDTYFSEWSEYVRYWGTSSYYFEVQTPHYKDLYISLDTSDGTLGVKQMKWLRDLLAQATKQGYRHKVVYTHTHFYKPDGAQGHTSNFPMEETYEIASLLSESGVEWYVSGHRHSRDITTFKGVTYYIIDAIQEAYADEDAYYFIASVGEELSGEIVHLYE